MQISYKPVVQACHDFKIYRWCTKELSVVRGQAFLSSFKKNTEVIISPQAQWKVRVRETDSDYVI